MRWAAVLPLVPIYMYVVGYVWFNAFDENGVSAEVCDYVTETWVEGESLTEWNLVLSTDI